MSYRNRERRRQQRRQRRTENLIWDRVIAHNEARERRQLAIAQSWNDRVRNAVKKRSEEIERAEMGREQCEVIGCVFSLPNRVKEEL